MILIVYGTRPEYIKVKPLMVEMDKQGIIYKTLFTGQHKDIVTEGACFNLHMKHYGDNRLDNIIQNCINHIKIPVFIALQSFKAKALQEHEHPGEEGRVARHDHTHAFPFAFETDIEVIHDVLRTTENTSGM